MKIVTNPVTPVPARKKQNKLVRFLNSKKVVPFVFISPFVLSLLLFTVYPAIQGVMMSFQSVLPGQVEFIGMANYERVFNPTFYRAVSNTTLYVIFTVLILTIIPMILAVILNSKHVRFRNIFRASLFIPALTSTIVGGMIFRFMFSEQDSAVANQFIGFFGFDSVKWMFSPWAAILLMVLLASWRWIGVNILYFLAALQNVPDEMYEAAQIDGATRWQRFRFITMPMLKPIIVFVSTITIINGFRMFEESYVFWAVGSPGNIGLSIAAYIYQQGIQQNDMGFGAALGVVLMLIIFVISIIYLIATGTFKKEGR